MTKQEARKEYMRHYMKEYRKKNSEKIKQIQIDYWMRRCEKLKEGKS